MRRKTTSGITLIALVITIIVLLILAAISIAMLSGDNSILRRAKQATGYNYIGAAKDEVSLAYNSAFAKYLTNRYTEGITDDDKNLAKLMADELKKQVAANEGTTHSCKITYNESGVTTVTVEYKDDQGTKYTAIGTLKTTVGKEEFTWGGITTGAVTPQNPGGDDPTEFTISLEMTHNNVKPTAGGNVASVNDENIPIPTGFYPVAGTSKNGGFVISSVANDDLNNTKGGNQFVWVPVDQNQQLELKVSAPENITEIKLTDPAGEQINVGSFSGKTYTNANINPTYNGEYKVEVTAGETKTQTLVVRSLYAQDAFNDYFTDEWYASEDCLNMWKARTDSTTKEQVYQRLGNLADDAAFVAFAKQNTYNINGYSDPTENYANSVNIYGGFYIGRFEAGVKTKRTTGNASTTVNDIISASEKPLSQKNKDSYTYITRSQASGLAEAMYTGKSHLLTGAAWDRTLGWLVNTNNKTLKQINAYSTEWGNYNDDTFSGTTGIAKTGEFTQTKANNIYDLAGNVYEWTSENSPISGTPCVLRGGNYSLAGSYYPASNRYSYSESFYIVDHGFRVALFL